MFRRRVSYHKVVSRKLAYIRFSKKLPVSIRLFLTSVSKWWEHWVDFLLLGLVWTLAAATIIVSPPITFGVFYALRDPDEFGNRLKLMLDGAKQYAGIAYLNFLISLFVYALGLLNLVFYSSFESPWVKVLAGFAIAVLFAWTGMQTCLIPVLFQQKTRNLWFGYRNAAGLFLANAINSIALLIFLLLVTAASIIFPPLLFVGSPILMMIYIHFMASHAMLQLNFIQPDDTQYHDAPEAQEHGLLVVYEDAISQEKKTSSQP